MMEAEKRLDELKASARSFSLLMTRRVMHDPTMLRATVAMILCCKLLSVRSS